MSREHDWEGTLEHTGEPAELAPEHEPPGTTHGRTTEWVADHDTESRDIRPALGTHGGPAPWTAAEPGAPVALARPGFGDARWSFLYKARDTGYAAAEPAPGQVAAANRRMRNAPVSDIHGPFIHAPVWSWEVPLYFWFGGMASGAGFVALACDAAGDHRSAAIARKVALGAVAPAPVLLIGDLGRPERFLNMMRIFKPRSPMNTGAWCLLAFSGSIATGGGLRPGRAAARPPARLGALTSVLGGYLGSYTGVLLACTAVPVWSRSRYDPGPGVRRHRERDRARPRPVSCSSRAACPRPPDRRALRRRAMLARHDRDRVDAHRALALGSRRAAAGRRRHRAPPRAPGSLLPRRQEPRRARALVCGWSRAVGARPSTTSPASCISRPAWPSGSPGSYAGKASADDDAAVAAMGRGRRALHEDREEPREQRALSTRRSPLPMPDIARRAYGEAVRRTSLAIERRLRRHRQSDRAGGAPRRRRVRRRGGHGTSPEEL